MQQTAENYDIAVIEVLALESRLRTLPLVNQCVVVGEGDDYYAALLVPDKLRLIQHLRELDPEQMYRLDGYHRLNDLDVRAVYCDLLEEINASSTGKRIERFALLESANGRTRDEILANNQPIIDSLYQDYVPGIG